MSLFKKENRLQNLAALVVVFLAGFFIFSPQYNCIALVSMGDHGRDFYAAQQALSGAMPYTDYWWVYGPLMPSYYALFYKFLGGTIQSLLIGKILLILLCGLFFYLTLATFTTPAWACLGAIWFFLFNEDFFFTFNHIGAICLTLFLLWQVFLYMKDQKPLYLNLSLCAILLICLVKVNFGFAALATFVLTFTAIDYLKQPSLFLKRKRIYLLCLALPIIVLAIYGLLVRGLSIPEIRQCLPYLSGDQPHSMSVFSTLKSLFISITFNMFNGLTNILFAIIIIISTVHALSLLVRRSTPKETRIDIGLTLFILIAFYVAYLHEYLVSGVLYRSYWSRPFSLLLIFSVISFLLRTFPALTRFLLYSVMALMIILKAPSQAHAVKMVKIAPQFLNHPRAQVFVGNSVDWIQTVSKTTGFLEKNLEKDELFFALPYDTLYYYLTAKPSPTRQLIFFEHIKIPIEQEKEIISELEQNRVNWVVASSRMVSSETGLGVLGKTYCPLIGEYIFSNFEPVVQYGNWAQEAGWAWNHGTLILKRKNPLP